MKFKNDLLHRYISLAPLALAFERYLECQIFLDLSLERPILDLGCGEGLFANILFSEKIDTGIDPNPRELQRARQLDSYDELIQCFGDNIPKPDGSYMTIFSNSALEHISNLSPVLQEVFRLLSVGGVFYFTVPSDKFDRYSVIYKILSLLGSDSWADKYRKFYNHFWRHYHYHPLEKWEELIRAHGFEISQSFEYDPETICRTNDFLAPFGFIPFLIKKLTNRWVLLPSLRGFLIKPFIPGFLKTLKNGYRAEEGGLIFIAAKKVNR
ncbi:MAG: class I SAM-dependent methyltransferase [Anaerolinea sp.]|nr:class I SAM-dependent methyltransferase [Anaerolinea sp.]